MKTRVTIPAIALVVLTMASSQLQSQSPSKDTSAANKKVVTFLQQIKASNNAVLEKQQATLQQLQQLTEEAREIKTLAKRG